MKFPWLWSITVVLVGALGMSAVWLAASLFFPHTGGWLAWVAAVDIAFMLNLAGIPHSQRRALMAMLGTALTVLASQWLIVAVTIGFALGINPLPSVLRLGPVLAWKVTRLNLQYLDWIFIVLSLPLAGFLAGRKVSSR